MNPLYQQLMGGPMNPFARMQNLMSAMNNPAAFVKQAFPDIPEGIQNDPNQILGYLQQTRNISNAQIQQLINQMQGFTR